MEIDVPRDRNGEFEPQLMPKHKNTLTQDIEAKIISMYAKGMTTGDIETHIKDLYGIEMSDSTISRVTDKILPIAKEWQNRPLEEIYAVVFMDAIHFHVRSEGQIIKEAVYIAIGINMDGCRDVLGLWIGENESAKFWLSVMNGLRNRGVEDILIACVDGLTVFPTDDSLFKMLYLATMDITRKWIGRRKDWGQIHSQPEIFFSERLD
jgi:transposase-like protein